jgi:protein-disulfide isomerase
MDKLKSFLGYITPFNLILVAIATTALYGVYIGYSNWSTLRQLEQPAPGHLVKPSEKPANLTVIMFYDYRCPFCFQLDPIVRSAAERDGQVELLFKFLPSLGEASEYLARVAYAAGEEGKFLEAHDYIMQGGTREYNEAEIDTMAKSLGLDPAAFKKKIDSDAAKNKVKENMDLALKLGVYSTPTLIIGDTFFIPEVKMPDEAKILELFNRARAGGAE